eukprot:447398-Rhodomonas_salina.1
MYCSSLHGVCAMSGTDTACAMECRVPGSDTTCAMMSSSDTVCASTWESSLASDTSDITGVLGVRDLTAKRDRDRDRDRASDRGGDRGKLVQFHSNRNR